MFAQIITMKVPIGDIQELRMLIAEEYLPEVSTRPGFISAGLLEQVDDHRNKFHRCQRYADQNRLDQSP